MRADFVLCAAAALLAGACSFDYGALSDEPPESVPDVVMTEVEYVRVRDGVAVVRLQAESVERYEADRRIVVTAPRFEQYAGDGSEGASGSSSAAVVHSETGDVDLSGGVSLSIPEEELTIETEALSWKDEDRKLKGKEEAPVLVKKIDGSYLSGTGFTADARSRSWELSGSVAGVFVEDEDEGASAGPSDQEKGE
jgi:LPS export ABC transporter protein LptC